jgi:hypothetical protein
MEKIMSTRVDESVIRHVDALAKALGISKKAVLENAVRHYAQKIETDKGFDVLAHTLGSWQRSETPAATVRNIKDTMRASQERHKQ